MRAVCILLLLAVMLSACSAATTPTRRGTPAPDTMPSRGYATVPAATATGRSQAETAPAPPTAAPVSTLPAYLRTLDFRIPAGNSYNPQSLALHPALHHLYARTHGRSWDSAASVTVLDPASGGVLLVAETGPDDQSSGDLAVDAVRNLVYAVNRGDQTAAVLDADTLAPGATLADVEQLALDADAGVLAVAGTASLRVLDSAGYGVLCEVPLPPDSSPFDLALDAVAGRIYLVVQDPGGYSLLTYDTQTLAELNRLRLAGQPDGLVANPGRGEVYVSAGNNYQDLLSTIDSEGRLLAERTLGDSTRRTTLALGGGGRRLFLGRDLYSDYAVEVLNLEDGQQVAEIALSSAPYSMLWDQGRSRLWVCFTYENLVVDVDVEAGRVVAAHPTAIGLTDVEVDPQRGYLLVADTAGWLHVVDGVSGAERALLQGGPQIAIDPAHGRYYTGGRRSATVRVCDAERLVQTGEIPFSGVPVADGHLGGLYIASEGIHLVDLETLSVAGVISDTLPQSPGYSPNPTAVDAVVDSGTGRIFAIVSNGVPGSNGGSYLNVYEPVTFEKVLEDRERSPISIDVTPGNGWAYISRVHLAGASTSLLVDGRTYAARIDSLYGGVRVDPELNRAFVSASGGEAGRLYVLSATTLDVLGAVPIAEEYDLSALDPVRHLLYLVREDGLVQVWSATGGQPVAAEQPLPADLGVAGPYRLFVPAGGEVLFALDTAWHAYRSDDSGESWGRLAGGLPPEMTTDLALSPSFQEDHILFAAVSTGNQGYGIWKSDDAGGSWSLASRGLTDLGVSDLAISPAFATDHTLYASAHAGGLYRSVDAGATWLGLTYLYRPPETYPGGPSQLVLAPTFGEEQTLFIEHYGFRRSDDGGDSWHTVADTGSGYFWRRFILAPDYASSHVVYCLSISLETGGLAYLLGSDDGGETWTDLGRGPVPVQSGDGRLLVTPAGVAYLVWMPYYPATEPELFRSGSLWPEGRQPTLLAWEKYVGPPLLAVTPLELSADGAALAALDAGGHLLRWPLAGLAWEPVAPQTPMPTPTPR